MALFKVEPTLEVEFKVLCNECRLEWRGAACYASLQRSPNHTLTPASGGLKLVTTYISARIYRYG